VIRAGVIGAGDLARRHAAALEAAGCESVVIGGEELIRSLDVAVVASEPHLRFHHTALALEHGLDVLVEQPVAPTVENARMLERIASLRPSRPVVQVSQPDHFNPALRRAGELAEGSAPVAVDIRRLLSEPSGMLHDVHTLIALARSPLVRLQASGTNSYAVATLVFESGLVGTLAAGCTGRARAHEVVVTTTDAVIAADALTGAVEIARGEVREHTQMPVGDQLASQARSFLAAVRERGRPDVGLRTAAACQEVVAAVRDCLAIQAAAAGEPSQAAPGFAD
jgi:predicted dehydrogenase